MPERTRLLSIAGEPVATQHFLACRDCLAVSRIYPPPPADGVDDEPSFLDVHGNHCMEPMTRVGDACLATRPIWDPLATTYIEVTNGTEVFVVRAARPSIDQPIERTLLVGRLRADGARISFDEPLLRRALDAHFYPQTLRVAKVDRLLAAAHRFIDGLDPEALCIVFDAADDPQVSIARLPREVFDALWSECAEVFDEWELGRVRSFLEQNDGDDGLLTLRVTRAFALEAA